MQLIPVRVVTSEVTRRRCSASRGSEPSATCRSEATLVQTSRQGCRSESVSRYERYIEKWKLKTLKNES